VPPFQKDNELKKLIEFKLKELCFSQIHAV